MKNLKFFLGLTCVSVSILSIGCGAVSDAVSKGIGSLAGERRDIYVIRCAWDSSHIIARGEYGIQSRADGTHTVWIYPGSSYLTETFTSLSDAKRGIRQHLLSNAEYYTYEGMIFCSLRCLNAYKASTDIKERRYRIIPHE